MRIAQESDLPPQNQLTEVSALTGQAIVITEGDGEIGTGKSDLWSWWDNSQTPPVMVARETFADGETLYFKTTPLNVKPSLNS